MTQSKGLLALSCGTFALGMAEFSMMAILSPLAHNLGVSIPEAGDFISAYAAGVSVGAPLPLLFRRQPLKRILLGLCLLICAGNLCAAFAQGYWSLAGARFISGLPHGAYFGVAAIVATSLVEPGRKATAVAIMVSGMTIANLIGVPAATWLANTMSWRYAFGIASCCAILAFLGILAFTPSEPPRSDKGIKREFAFLKKPAPWLIFAATFLGQGSVYCWYSYMEPIMLNVTHVPPFDMKWVMVVTGLGMFVGTIVCGRLADRFHASLVCAFTGALIVPTLLMIYFFSLVIWIAIPLAFIGSAALFGLGGPLQYLIVRFSRGGEILGGAGIQIAFNASNAIAALLGGAAIRSQLGLPGAALVGIPMAVACSAILFWFYSRYGRDTAAK